jgi:tetratricopeptide (TPR) repeat protein
MILTLMIASAEALAQADRHMAPYRSGFNAFNLFRWEKAAEEMRKAIAANPSESGKDVHIQLLTWKPYVPHFYLGISLAKLGRCEEAIPALEETLRQGVLPDTRGFRERAEATLTECRAASPRRPAPQTVARDEQPEQLDERPASTTTAAPSDATAAVHEPGPRDAVAPVPAPFQTPPAAEPVKDRGRSVSAEEHAQPPARTQPDSRRQTEAPASDLLLSAPAAEIPAPLVSAVDSYLRGKYADAVRILDGLTITDVKQRAHVLLFRAASLHALFLLGQARDGSLEARASRDLAEFRRLRPGAAADPRVFSPRFLELLRQTR